MNFDAIGRCACVSAERVCLEVMEFEREIVFSIQTVPSVADNSLMTRLCLDSLLLVIILLRGDLSRPTV